MKITKKNAGKVCTKFAAVLVSQPDILEAFNDWLNEQLENDAFGTEGQLDPRRDRRDQP